MSDTTPTQEPVLPIVEEQPIKRKRGNPNFKKKEPSTEPPIIREKRGTTGKKNLKVGRVKGEKNYPWETKLKARAIIEAGGTYEDASKATGITVTNLVASARKHNWATPYKVQQAIKKYTEAGGDDNIINLPDDVLPPTYKKIISSAVATYLGDTPIKLPNPIPVPVKSKELTVQDFSPADDPLNTPTKYNPDTAGPVAPPMAGILQIIPQKFCNYEQLVRTHDAMRLTEEVRTLAYKENITHTLLKLSQYANALADANPGAALAMISQIQKVDAIAAKRFRLDEEKGNEAGEALKNISRADVDDLFD